jgi:hypothetical protein
MMSLAVVMAVLLDNRVRAGGLVPSDQFTSSTQRTAAATLGSASEPAALGRALTVSEEIDHDRRNLRTRTMVYGEGGAVIETLCEPGFTPATQGAVPASA